MSEKFTKGPWSINHTGPHWNNPELANIEINYGEDQECVCDTVYEISDAHLIAAAPDMYEMLSAILRDEIKGVEMCLVIESVLAKARGES